MECAHCGINLGRPPWQQHVCELCLRVIERGAICSRCRRITYKAVAGLCPRCYTETLEPTAPDFAEHTWLDDVYDEVSDLMPDFARSESTGWFYSDNDDGVLSELTMHERHIEDDEPP